MVIPTHQGLAERLGLAGASPTRIGKPQRMGGTPYVSERDFPFQDKKKLNSNCTKEHEDTYVRMLTVHLHNKFLT